MEKAEKLILTAGPSITEKEIAYVNDAVSNGWNEKWNEYIIKFQEEFSRYIGVKHALATSSCTGAMHLGLKSFGIKENDEVIVPEITWIATASAVTYVNAKPVFVDIEEDTWCINPESIRKAITSKTKAIMPVHLYGHPANMDEIMEISEANNLIIIEDAAPSLGASYKDKKTGSFGDCSAFSFQGAKTATTGEGGILLTNNSEKFQEIEKLSDHGRSFDKKLWTSEKMQKLWADRVEMFGIDTKLIEDIKPGDIVVGYNGDPVKVLQKHERLRDKFEGERLAQVFLHYVRSA